MTHRRKRISYQTKVGDPVDDVDLPIEFLHGSEAAGIRTLEAAGLGIKYVLNQYPAK
jgi:hypothetical protein